MSKPANPTWRRLNRGHGRFGKRRRDDLVQRQAEECCGARGTLATQRWNAKHLRRREGRMLRARGTLAIRSGGPRNMCDDGTTSLSLFLADARPQNQAEFASSVTLRTLVVVVCNGILGICVLLQLTRRSDFVSLSMPHPGSTRGPRQVAGQTQRTTSALPAMLTWCCPRSSAHALETC